jgi:SAM-dependent methyltransferase
MPNDRHHPATAAHHHPATAAPAAHAHHQDDAAMAEMLDLDAEVLHSYLSEVIGWVADTAVGPPRRILDLGAGTGAGALALAQRFTGAEVTAVDTSAPLLGRLQDKARELGVADRIHVIQADLDAGWPAVEPVDLVWASKSLHHMADPERVLADVFAALRPGGLLTVDELGSFPRFLATEPGAGLEERGHAALAAELAGELPHLGSDWAPRLRQAGFTLLGEREFAIDLTPPLPAAAGRYAQVSLRRLRSALDDRMSADDLAALDSLIDGDGPDGVLHRTDLTVRTARTVYLAERSRAARS